METLMGVDAQIAQQVTAFAKSVGVDAQFTDTNGTLELTDLFADNPGGGAGTQVMTLLGNLCDEHDRACVTHPSSPRNKVFYARFHFNPVSIGGVRLLLRYPASERERFDDFDPDDYPEGFDPGADGA